MVGGKGRSVAGRGSEKEIGGKEEWERLESANRVLHRKLEEMRMKN